MTGLVSEERRGCDAFPGEGGMRVERSIPADKGEGFLMMLGVGVTHPDVVGVRSGGNSESGGPVKSGDGDGEGPGT